MTKKWLVTSSPTNFAPFCQFWSTNLTTLMDNLEEGIRTGKSPQNLYEWIEHQPETSSQFQRAMTAIARFGGDEIVGKLKLPSGPRRLLDIGGGHAMYSIALCQKYPELKATVLDSAQALQTAKENIADSGIKDRITLQEGNFMQDALGAGYDMALLFNIIHGLSPDLNKALFHKVAQALNPGGQIVIQEQLSGGSTLPLPMARASTRLLSLSFFHLIEGRTYSYDEVVSWLNSTGFSEPRRISLLKAPGNYLVTATVVSTS